MTWSKLMLYGVSLSVWLMGQGEVLAQQQLGVSADGFEMGHEGPWGQIEHHRIWLEAPDSMLRLISVPSEQVMWRFRGWNDTQVREFLFSLGLSDGLLNRFFMGSVFSASSDGVRIYPPIDAVIELPRLARSKIYTTLHSMPHNAFRNLIIFDGVTVSEHFGKSLPEPMLKLVEVLVWDLQGQPVFSDFEVLLSQLPPEMSELDLMRAMSRRQSVMMRLDMAAVSDVEEFRRYWTRDYLDEDVLQFIDSISNVSNARRVDVSHLLPSYPRQFLYTYPDATSGIEGGYPDSFWTALNFFRGDDPLPLITDTEYLKSVIADQYVAVDRPAKYGDLIYFSDKATGAPIHATIYIADGLVFFKNGNSPFNPWVLRKVPTAATFFRAEEEVEISIMKLKSSDGE